MFLRLAPTIGLLVALGAVAHAQVNIDRGKPPAEMFANDCAACHKTTRGLAPGKNSLMLTTFLREHYTTSREQAAALAAYVLGAGGGEKPAQKPGSDHAKVEEPKTTGRPTQQTAKPEGEAPTAKLQPPTGEEAKPEEQPGVEAEPGGAGPRPAVRGRDARPGMTTRGHTPPAQEPAAMAAAPTVNGTSANETPNPEMSPTTSAAVPTASGEGEFVPRDNIPD